MPDTSQLSALIRLYDDDSQAVRGPVLDRLAGFGDALEPALKALPATPPPELIDSVLEAVAQHVGAPSPAAVKPATPPDAAIEAQVDGSPRASETTQAPDPRAPRAPVRRLVRYEEGQLVRHRRYGYRGVIVARDPTCSATDEWYEANRTRPPRDQPWYHVLVDGASHVTYAAQSSLLPDESMRAVEHPLVPFFFRDFADGRYRRNDRTWPSLET